MRKATMTTGKSQLTMNPKTIPAPIGGLNARDSLAAMGATDAVVLENFVCQPSKVQTRKGVLDFLTGITGVVQSLLVYRSASTQKMFAATQTGLFASSVAGTVGASVVTLTSGKLQYINFSTAGGSYLLFVNGVDDMKSYNGTTWSNAAITGPGITGFTTSMFNTITQFKHRVFMTAVNSSSFFYMGIDAIAGEVKEYPLGTLFPKGGALLSCLNWTIDGGDGPDDYSAFITTEGELALYKGTDPTDASAWALQGVFQLPRPVGKKCLFKYGGDVLVITESGIYPLSKVLLSEGIDPSVATTDKISGLFATLAANYSTNHGWECQLYSKESLLLVNVPVSDGETSHQYVMNTLTKAWSKLTGLNATCFAIFNNLLYYGTSGKVVQAFVGVSDNGAVVLAKCQQAYNYFDRRGAMKHVEMLRPGLEAAGSYSLGLGVTADFKIAAVVELLPLAGNTSGGVFDDGLWGTAIWGYEIITDQGWKTVASNEGVALSLLLQISSNKTLVGWTVTDYTFSSGFILG